MRGPSRADQTKVAGLVDGRGRKGAGEWGDGCDPVITFLLASSFLVDVRTEHDYV